MARAAAEPSPSLSRQVAIIAILLLAVLAAVAGWWFWPKSTQVPQTVALAKSLLGNGGKPDNQAIRQVVTSVDRMPREDLFQLWRAVGEEWLRLRQEAIDRYFTAPARYATAGGHGTGRSRQGACGGDCRRAGRGEGGG